MVTSGSNGAPGVAATKSGNCFVEGSDFDQLKHLAKRLNQPESL